jgi:hypothetical protein
MNAGTSRNVVLGLAVLLIGAGLSMTLMQIFFSSDPIEPVITVGVAAQQIEPYTIITQDMIRAGESIGERDAWETGAYPVDAVVGKMTADLISPGTVITGVNAKPIEDVRFVEDLGLEVVSFQAGLDRLVGGQLRPGHLINLYGFGKDKATREDFTSLIEPRLWVVQVSSNGRPSAFATPRPDPKSGIYDEEANSRQTTSTMITVAVEPERAFKIIDALGARGLSAWVTLSANSLAEMPTAVPAVVQGPTPDYMATIWASPGMIPTPDLMPGTGFGGMADR